MSAEQKEMIKDFRRGLKEAAELPDPVLEYVAGLVVEVLKSGSDEEKGGALLQLADFVGIRLPDDVFDESESDLEQLQQELEEVLGPIRQNENGDIVLDAAKVEEFLESRRGS